MRTIPPRPVRVVFYGFFLIVLFLILSTLMTKLVPGKLGITISRNSEGFLTLLVVAAWIDFIRPRLLGRRHEWSVALGVGAALLVAGLVLRGMPWPSRFVTLNEALIGLSVLVVYLQLRRPVRRLAFAVPLVAILVPALTSHESFTVDMAEAFGGLVVIPFVVDVVDRRLLQGRLPNVAINVAAAVGLVLFIWLIHLVTPKPAMTAVAETTYYVQRATEMFIAGAALLLYYSTRRAVLVSPTTERIPVLPAANAEAPL